MQPKPRIFQSIKLAISHTNPLANHETLKRDNKHNTQQDKIPASKSFSRDEPLAVMEPIRVDADRISGQLWLYLPAGTTVPEREKRLNQCVSEALFQAAQTLGVVLEATPCSYAQLTGKLDEAKRTEFVVQGRVEGDRLVPIRLRHRKPR